MITRRPEDNGTDVLGDAIKERTYAGLTAARARAGMGGRSPMPVDDPHVQTAKKMHGDKTMAIGDICTTLWISRPTLYQWLALKSEVEL